MEKPDVETFQDEDSARARVGEMARSRGGVFVEMEDLVRGMRGVCASSPEGTWPTTVVEWPVYGRELKELKAVIRTPAQLEAAFSEHSDHARFQMFLDPETRSVGAICHCLAAGGKSVVFQVPLKVVEELPPQMMADIRSMFRL